MLLLRIAIGVFVVLEIGNVVILYVMPDSRLANAMGYFKAWEKSKGDPEVHEMAKYLVNWVAGTKLIFILLLIIFLVRGDDQTLPIVGVAMVISIATFFWRLFPTIKDLDSKDQIEPKGYSKTLFWMIVGMIVLFAAATLVAFLG
jgi:cytochrome b561